MFYRSLSLLYALLLALPLISQQDTVKVMYYNILGFPFNYPGREVHFRTIHQYVKADIIVVNELVNDDGANILLNQALNVYGATHYGKAIFTDGPDSDNMLFYDASRFTLYSQYVITTSLRHINEYVLYYNSSELAEGDTVFLRFYSAHLKAGYQSGDVQQRLAEVTQFRGRVDNIPDAENIIFGGDLNLQSSSEPAYNTLVNNGVYPLHDPLPAGSWNNNSAFSLYHTQSSRTSAFGGGASGGLDDRFDFTLFSYDALYGANGVSYIPGSAHALGNDGNHFNKALIDPPVNPHVPDSVIQALYYMSDHLPVITSFLIDASWQPPVEEILIITEIMKNPEAVPDSRGEWFELFNPTTVDINLKGWIIADNDYDWHQITQDVIVSSRGFVTLGNNSDPALNGNYQSDYQYASFFLSNGEDEIVLINPDGVTVVDHVEYDDGILWPDPDGASLVFTGTEDDDNNLPQFWSVATTREPTYAGTEGDLGSPGVNGTGQNLITVEFALDVRVYLGGPFQVNVMSNALNSVLPLSQPYAGSPWFFEGAEAVENIPLSQIVDWVLVELRDAPDVSQATSATVITRKAVFLKNDGYLTGLSGTALPVFQVTVYDSLYVVIYHRNHLSVMSAAGLLEADSVFSYDFTTSADKAVGGALGHVEVKPGIWAMSGADGDANGQVNNGDKNDVWVQQAGMQGYQAGDFNMDGQVNNGDKIEVWSVNTGQGSQVPQ